jgi:hypothetical protein
MFQIHFAKRLQIVNPMVLEPIDKQNAKLIDALVGPDEHVSDRAAAQLSKDQPWVWKVSAAHLLESDNPNLDLSDKDKIEVAIVMKTVIDALNRSVQR